MNEMVAVNAARMTSLEIAELVGKRHDNVKRTVETLIKNGVITSPQIEEKPTAGRPVSYCVFEGEQGKRDSIVVVAQLCPEFTARLVDRWMELEEQVKQLAAPQQQLTGTPGTPEHFLDFITQGVTQALTQAYREYFGEPVLPSLTAQQQHTEPVQALPAEPAQAKVEYRKPPQDKRSWAKLSKYIARKDIVMKCFEICGVHSEQFDPGYILDEDGKLIHCDEHTVYDRKQALAVIMAIYELSVPVKNSKQRKLAGKYRFKDKLGNRCFTDISKSAINTAKQMIQAYIMKHGKLI